MPLYEYRCSKCGDAFEVMQKLSDPPVETCRKCGGKIVKLLSRSAIQFKGGGWYVTDYSGKGGPKTDSTDSKSKDSTKDSGTKDGGDSSKKGGDSSKKGGDSSKKGGDTPKEKASSGVT